MTRYVQSIAVEGLHRTKSYPGSNITMDFLPGVNVVYGHNGTGKTTLLNILANALDNNFAKFSHLAFESITLRLSDGEEIKYWSDENGSKRVHQCGMEEPEDVAAYRKRQPQFIGRRFVHADGRLIVDSDESDDSTRDRSYWLERRLTTAAYFPAFRAMSEVIRLIGTDRFMPQHILGELSEDFHERAFGPFAPDVEYPSSSDIADRLKEEVQRVVALVSRQNSSILSNLSVDVLKAMPDVTDDTQQAIQDLVKQLQETPIYDWLPEVATAYSRLNDPNSEAVSADAATLYTDSLERILNQQMESYEHIDNFRNSVNEFLNDKELVITTRTDTDSNQTDVGIRRELDPEGELIPLDTMSSGERQIISLLYAASFLGEHNLVLIDEPEISLHIKWQYQFAQAMARILGSKQLIVCTHSPEILTGFEDVEGGCNSIELDPIPNQVYR